MSFFEDNSNESLKLNFKIEEDIAINPSEFQTYNSEFCGNGVVCQLDRVNGVRVLTYTIPAHITLAQFLKKKLYAWEFTSLFCNILRQFIFFEDKRMPVKKTLLNSQYINIDLTNLTVQLIYMPIEKNFAECDINGFLKEFISRVSCGDDKCQEYLTGIKNYINSCRVLDIRELYKYVLGLAKVDVIEVEVQEDMDEGDTKVLTNNTVKAKTVVPYLVRIKTNELIHINKPVFNVGKGSDSDYQITDNRKISRKHCTFRFSNGQCYVRDNGSTNHTYVNGMNLTLEKEILLKNEDYIKLADEEFKYWER